MASTVDSVYLSSWSPEDDLLLKNAVEAGASLEALAKGAVQFSRRFTLQELRDRWHSLLYDPEISKQASIHMFQLELSGSNLSKFNRCENSKGSKVLSEKRKLGSIREQYYAMRKRIRSELSLTNLNFVDEHDCHDGSGLNVDLQEHVALNEEPPIATSLGNYGSNHLELNETDFDILRNAFPEEMRAISPICSLENNHASRLAREEDCLYGISGDVSSSAGKDNITSFGISSESRGVPGTIEDTNMHHENCNEVKEHDLSIVFPDKNQCGIDDSEMKSLSTFVSENNDSQNVCSVFGEKQDFISPDSHGSAAFRTHWKTMEDITSPSMQVNVVGSQNAEGISELIVEDNDKKRSVPTYNDEQSVPHLRDKHAGLYFVNSTAVSDGELVDLSDTLVEFSSEDFGFLTDADGKEKIDNLYTQKPTLGSYSSNNNVIETEGHGHENENANSIVLNACNPHCSASCAESRQVTSPVHDDCRTVSCSEISEVSVPVTRGHNDIDTYCTLNTEDTEIPCNDDIFLLIHPSAVFTSSEMQSAIVSSVSLSTVVNHKNGDRPLDLVKKGREAGQSVMWSHKVGQNILPERGLGSSSIKTELHPPNSKTLLLRDCNSSLRETNQFKLHANANPSMDGVLNVTQVELGQVVDLPADCGDKKLHVEAEASKWVVHNPIIHPSISNLEEPESDNDLPYFSDIEAMILEMDLDPHDLDSHTSRHVYRSEATKRTIIRLEQCAHSSLQRAMTSRGALAFFYGRHLKHYIKKTEVMLGRSTDDVDVDIDLRKEGRANKVSRRQAIIKMEKDGSFSLKNLGKCSISVNGKSIAAGQLMGLSSSCLIEIRGMCFVFEINEKYVRQYADKQGRKSSTKNSKFEWSPEKEP